jgi:4'-phosphopantetheinyl transferase EntD
LAISISHTDGFACAVTGTEDGIGLGVDIERSAALESEVFARVFDAEERKLLSANLLGDLDAVTAFSLKESAFKAANSLCRVPLTLNRVSLSIDPAGRPHISLRHHDSAPSIAFAFRIWHWHDFVVTLVRCTRKDTPRRRRRLGTLSGD